MHRYWLRDKLFELKQKRQRYKRKFADVDVWNINTWFLDIMPKMLMQLKDERYGYPYGMTDDEWERVLGRMIFCFTEANEDTCSMKNEYEDQLPGILKRDDLTSVEDQETYNKWFDRAIEICEHRKKMQDEGLELFKKYFDNLWD